MDAASARTFHPLFLVSFGVAVAIFVATTAYSAHVARQVDDHVAFIADEVAPSIEHLATARGELREVWRLADAMLDHRSSETAAALEQARVDLRSALTAYSALPSTGGRRELVAWVEKHSAFDAAVDELLREKSDSSGHRVEASASELSSVLTSGIVGDARQSQATARRVAMLRESARMLVAGMCAACAIVTVLAASALAQGLRRRARDAEAQAALFREHAAELDTFTSRVAHDLRSFLGGVTLAVGALRRHTEGSSSAALAARADRSARRAIQLLDGLLAFARAGATPEPGAQADVAEVIDGVLEEAAGVAREEGTELTVDVNVSGHVACAPGVLISLLSNLVGNAIKHMGDSEPRLVTVRALQAGARIRISVEDTGPGILPSQVARAFEAYVRLGTARKDGMGLGLATVKRLAERHDGAVGCASRVGGGSTFWFELPMAPRESGERATIAEEEVARSAVSA